MSTTLPAKNHSQYWRNGTNVCVLNVWVTVVVNDWQGWNSTVGKDRQRSAKPSVWLDVGNVGVGPHR